MSSNLYKSYDDEPLFPDADDFTGSAGGGSWDYVPPEESALPADAPLHGGNSLRGIVAGTPARILQLYDKILHEDWTITRNRAFYYQAKMMADYEDHADIVPFHAYYPTYRDMTVEQLRSYFSIRLMLRQGKTPAVPLSYLFVYIYELLMKIGCKDAEKALQLLQEVSDNYSGSEPAINRYLPLWIRDFVVYNNLTEHVARYFAAEQEVDSKALVLANRDTVADELLFQTVVSLSNYSIKAGALYKKRPDVVEAVVPRVVRAVAPLYEARTHHRFETLCMGLKKKVSHPMFASAVFYDPQPVRQQEVVVSFRRKFVCRGGLWSTSAFSPLFPHRGGPIGSILRETDRRLRIALKLRQKLLRSPIEREVEAAIQQTVGEWMKDEAKKRRPRVTVDLSKLDRIRDDAEVVRDALLTDEERTDGSPQPAAPPPQPTAPPPSAGQEPQHGGAVFSPEEADFLRLLLRGGDWPEFLRSHHIPLGVMVDGINSKAVDWIGDVVMEDSDEGPVVIEDYKEDIANEIKT